MPLVVSIPDGYAYVPIALLSTVWISLWQNTLVSKYRKLSGIKYPQLYAEKAEMEASRDAFLFNCAQRVHHNTLELIPVIVLTTLIGGLKLPILAASSCALWSVGRISYTFGYLTGDPKKRNTPLYGVSYLGLFALLGSSAYAAGGWFISEIQKLV